MLTSRPRECEPFAAHSRQWKQQRVTAQPSTARDPLEALHVPGWQHRHSGHCESGVAANLLSHHGLPLTEPMAFGLSSSLIFAHFPFIRIGGQPLTAYRALPGHVLRQLERRLSVRLGRRRFRDPDKAREALDTALSQGTPVGIQASVFWLPYFPPEMRFHFNAHNLVVVGRDTDGAYRVSDPVFENPQRCDGASLEQARFVRGAFAPRGLMYWVESVERSRPVAQAIPAAIRTTIRLHGQAPVPWVGLRAVRLLARRIRQLPQRRPDIGGQRLYVGQIIRMQEEIGTGGGGFRFMYASFLQEAAEHLQDEGLERIAGRMIEVGDRWRDFALSAAHFCQDRHGASLTDVAARLEQCADAEAAAVNELKQWARRSGR